MVDPTFMNKGNGLVYVFYFGMVRVRPLVRCAKNGQLCALKKFESEPIDIGYLSANPENPVDKITPSN